MHKKILATAISFALAAPAMAITLVDDGTNKLSVGGRIGFKAQTEKSSNFDNDSSRINFAFESKLTDTLTGYAKTEWSFKGQDKYDDNEKEDLLSNRLGLIGVKHETFGAVQIGKQWSVYSSIANWTDEMPVGGGNAMGMYEGYSGDGGVNGTGRADDAISYRFSMNGFNLGLQYQAEEQSGTVSNTDANRYETNRTWKRDSGAQIALSYDFNFGMSVGYTYNQTQFTQREDTTNHVVAVKYDSEKVYAAATYGKFENQTNAAAGAGYAGNGTFDKESTGIELFAQYNIVENIGVYAGYNQLSVDEAHDGTSSDGKLDYTMFGAVYKIGPMQFAAEYTFDNSKGHTGNSDKDDFLTVHARYYF